MKGIIGFIRWLDNSLEEMILEKLAIFETDREVRMIYAIFNDNWYNEYNELIPTTDRDRAVEYGIIHN